MRTTNKIESHAIITLEAKGYGFPLCHSHKVDGRHQGGIFPNQRSKSGIFKEDMPEQHKSFFTMPFSEADPVPSGTGHGKAERAIWLVGDTKTSGLWVSPYVSLLGLARHCREDQSRQSVIPLLSE